MVNKMTEFGQPNFYADEECTKPLKTIEWDNGFKLTLVNGEEVVLRNTVVAGQLAIATFYIRNEEKYRFAVTKMIHPDERLKLSIENPWLFPLVPVRIILKYQSPSVISSKNIVQKAKIKIEGYYIVE